MRSSLRFGRSIALDKKRLFSLFLLNLDPSRTLLGAFSLTHLMHSFSEGVTETHTERESVDLGKHAEREESRQLTPSTAGRSCELGG